MGQEIADSKFKARDFERFKALLTQETRLLASWFEADVFSESGNVGGFELEAWLVDERFRPAPINVPYLERLDSPLVVPELATFNVELNGSPQPLRGAALQVLEKELNETWTRCNRVAAGFGAGLAMIGILPTVSPADLTLSNMSPWARYRALNEQVLRLRGGRPLQLDIQGRDRLRLQHRDVMLESAATSFQIHLQLGAIEGVRLYNAAKIIAAPLVALSANSPFLFGRDLWAETRVPLFEQSVAVGKGKFSQRVTFGLRYAEKSLMECFNANLERFPVLLPRVSDEPERLLTHLRLHNGTIWRWVRPLIGFDSDGRPHLRIEHRVVPAGPTVRDSLSNAAFFFGAAHALAKDPVPPELRLPFEQSRKNFYAAARHGLDAELVWFDGRPESVSDLLRGELFPRAREGLEDLGIDAPAIDLYIGNLEGRAETGQNGSAWQRAYVAKHGRDMRSLAAAYLQHQAAGRPVHEWPL